MLNNCTCRGAGGWSTKSEEFWYPDGNVVIVVKDTAFKLYKARVSKYSAVLAAQFAEDDGAHGRPTMEGCPVYEVERLSVHDFTQFLEALETPIAFASDPLSQGTVISLLRSADVLDCADMRAFAIEKLRASWPNDKPKLPGGKRSVSLAARIIRVSRECDVPELRKRAFYEILRNPHTWTALAQNHTALKLPETDVIALLFARMGLQQLWCALVFEPPLGADGACKTCQGMRRGGFSRSAVWRNQMIEEGHFEAGRQDPIGYLETLLTEKRHELEAPGHTGWCAACIQDRAKAWSDAQVKWWAKLDDWFKS
ncbi:hypothetical protein L227DRAFT_586006 [Lentinus tigrinus ALCF2SS1-6]|uniref:BTB domain-containing protein n=1 Tax=Lentinus tigrinus ALCF2SS1-6 TaxID=1328759 RepID=A0A5C2SBG0_9APHY|nr:hypothetical protein L227DRAFT_586006 [Lentinus tigrinus ALCF2SS1-6]